MYCEICGREVDDLDTKCLSCGCYLYEEIVDEDKEIENSNTNGFVVETLSVVFAFMNLCSSILIYFLYLNLEIVSLAYMMSSIISVAGFVYSICIKCSKERSNIGNLLNASSLCLIFVSMLFLIFGLYFN